MFSNLRSSLLSLSSRLLQCQSYQVRFQYKFIIPRSTDKTTGKTTVLGDARKWLAGSDLGLVKPVNHASLRFYEKPWMKKKRLRIERSWNLKRATVKNAIKYISLKRDLEEASRNTK